MDQLDVALHAYLFRPHSWIIGGLAPPLEMTSDPVADWLAQNCSAIWHRPLQVHEAVPFVLPTSLEPSTRLLLSSPLAAQALVAMGGISLLQRHRVDCIGSKTVARARSLGAPNTHLVGESAQDFLDALSRTPTDASWLYASAEQTAADIPVRAAEANRNVTQLVVYRTRDSAEVHRQRCISMLTTSSDIPKILFFYSARNATTFGQTLSVFGQRAGGQIHAFCFGDRVASALTTAVPDGVLHSMHVARRPTAAAMVHSLNRWRADEDAGLSQSAGLSQNAGFGQKVSISQR